MVLNSATIGVRKGGKRAVLDLLPIHESLDEVTSATIQRGTSLPRLWAVAIPTSIPLIASLLQMLLHGAVPSVAQDWVKTGFVSVTILLVSLFGCGPRDIEATPRKEGPRSFTVDKRLRGGDVVELTYMAQGHRLHV